MNKKMILLIMAILIIANLNAQPTVNANDFPIGNEISYRYYGDTFLLSPGFSGHYDWDYTNLQRPYEFNVISHNCNSYCDSFSGSNFFDDETEENVKNYYLKVDSIFALNGYCSGNANTTVYNKFEVPAKLMSLPMVYEDTFSNTFQNSIATYLGATLISADSGSGNIAAIFDGYGSIKTPTGTYNNVLRLKQIVKIYSSQDTTEYESYQWYQAGIGHLIVETRIFPFQLNKSWYRYTTTPPYNSTDLNEMESNGLTLSIYPNPVQSLFNIRPGKPDNYNLIIRNIVGGVTFQTRLTDKETEKEIKTMGWTRGIYSLELKNESGVSLFRRIVVE